MKFIVAFVAFFAFATPSIAQDTVPYNQMTYEQLQQVEEKSLSKADRKVWKKAYKKAKKAFKKAEKARKKAEKKAERARKKAEKARLKAEKKKARAEAKRRAKIQKQISKKLGAINASYSETSISKDDFEASVRIRGKNNSQNNWDTMSVLGNGGKIIYFLRSFYNQNTHGLTIQAYTTVQFQRVVDQADLDYSGLSPARYAHRKGWYYGYTRAVLRGGKTVPFHVISHNAPSCSYYCKFNEEYAITLGLEDIQKSIETESSLDMKISSNEAPSLILSIPYHYMVGYMKRLSETDSRLAYLGKLPAEKISAIKAQFPLESLSN